MFFFKLFSKESTALFKLQLPQASTASSFNKLQLFLKELQLTPTSFFNCFQVFFNMPQSPYCCAPPRPYAEGEKGTADYVFGNKTSAGMLVSVDRGEGGAG